MEQRGRERKETERKGGDGTRSRSDETRRDTEGKCEETEMWGENCNFIYCPSLDEREALNTKEYLQFTNICLSNEGDKVENSSGVRREMWVRVCAV